VTWPLRIPKDALQPLTWVRPPRVLARAGGRTTTGLATRTGATVTMDLLTRVTGARVTTDQVIQATGTKTMTDHATRAAGIQSTVWAVIRRGILTGLTSTIVNPATTGPAAMATTRTATAALTVAPTSGISIGLRTEMTESHTLVMVMTTTGGRAVSIAPTVRFPP
jgi:hypothetical protein